MTVFKYYLEAASVKYCGTFQLIDGLNHATTNSMKICQKMFEIQKPTLYYLFNSFLKSSVDFGVSTSLFVLQSKIFFSTDLGINDSLVLASH